MGTRKTRQEKIEWIATVLDLGYDKDMLLSRKKLMAEFCLQCASTRSTCLEILQNFEDIGKIRIEGDDIVVSGKHY